MDGYGVMTNVGEEGGGCKGPEIGGHSAGVSLGVFASAFGGGRLGGRHWSGGVASKQTVFQAELYGTTYDDEKGRRPDMEVGRLCDFFLVSVYSAVNSCLSSTLCCYKTKYGHVTLLYLLEGYNTDGGLWLWVPYFRLDQ